MAKTPAERQAERRERMENNLKQLADSNSALVAELGKERDTSKALRAELEALKTRLQAAEMASLKAQVRQLKKVAQKPITAT